MGDRDRTHSMGLKCHQCKEVLVPAKCSCGSQHGYTFQPPGTWAAEVFSDHPCFFNLGADKETPDDYLNPAYVLFGTAIGVVLILLGSHLRHRLVNRHNVRKHLKTCAFCNPTLLDGLRE